MPLITGLKISTVCHRLHARNLLAACDGNVSVRVGDNEILITPSGVNKGFINDGDLAEITIDNKIVRGNPSGERSMHLSVYQNVSLAKAVVHAHPPTAIALSIAFPQWTSVPLEHMSELILAMGELPIVPYARPGSAEMGTVLIPHLPHNRNFILSRHGALSWGESLEEAYNGMERIEHMSQILMSALLMNSPLKPLPPEEISFLRQLRKQLGPKTL